MECAPTPVRRLGANPPVPPELTELQQALWRALEVEAQHVDALVAAGGSVGAGTADVLTALTELELRGVVRQGAGMVFGLVR